MRCVFFRFSADRPIHWNEPLGAMNIPLKDDFQRFQKQLAMRRFRRLGIGVGVITLAHAIITISFGQTHFTALIFHPFILAFTLTVFRSLDGSRATAPCLGGDRVAVPVFEVRHRFTREKRRSRIARVLLPLVGVTTIPVFLLLEFDLLPRFGGSGLDGLLVLLALFAFGILVAVSRLWILHCATETGYLWASEPEMHFLSRTGAHRFSVSREDLRIVDRGTTRHEVTAFAMGGKDAPTHYVFDVFQPDLPDSLRLLVHCPDGAAFRTTFSIAAPPGDA
jgi:hypothetical protein